MKIPANHPHHRSAVRQLLNSSLTKYTGIAILLWVAEPAGAFWNMEQWNTEFSPAGHLYRPYIADPHRATISLTRMDAYHTDVPDSGASRLGLRIGGNWGMFRFLKEGDTDHSLQLDLEVGLHGQFDSDNSTDLIGWNGRFGSYLSWWGPGGLALRGGWNHLSSHLGDEYIERTGRARVAYKREEVLLGASWDVDESWRIYGEGGYAYDLGNKEVQSAGRLEAGLELTPQAQWWNGRMGWYAATDVSSYQDNDWDPNLTLQAGLVINVDDLDRVYRFGVQYYAGRSQLGEFFKYKERIISLGFWFDL
jgi:hypothetical protein